ncbi:MAG: alpha/beta hydrolase [Patescibacteria group bacterium]
MEEKNISINGLNINYKVAEGGELLLDFAGIKIFPDKIKERGTVLILHGWGGSSDSWLEVQRILAKKGYKVIVPDLPGFGKSLTPPSPWGIKDYTDFVLKFIEETNSEKSRGEPFGPELTAKGLVEPFFLLGHSFGGRISVRLAAEYSEKIKGLILCDASGIKPKMGPKTFLIFWMARIGNAIFTPKHLARFKDSIRNVFYAFLRNKDYVKAKGTMRETITRVLGEDLSPELPKIKAKTLIVWGEADKVVPLKYGRIFKEKIANSELEIIPKIGHSPHIEVPAKLAEIILKFLNKNE